MPALASLAAPAPSASAPAPAAAPAGQSGAPAAQPAAAASANSLYFGGDLMQPVSNTSAPLPDAYSGYPIRYATGVLALSFTDLPSDNSGLPTGLTRSWTNGPGYSTGVAGSGMVFTQLPHLIQDSGGTYDVVVNGTTLRYFDPNGSGGYTQRYYGQNQFVSNGFANTFTETDRRGDQIVYNSFSSFVPAAERGSFKSYTDPNGNGLSVTSVTTDGKPAETQYSGNFVIHSYVFSYIASGTNAGLLSSVMLRNKVGTNSWVNVEQVVSSPPSRTPATTCWTRPTTAITPPTRPPATRTAWSTSSAPIPMHG
jgi:hypothetical protein